MNHSAEHNRKPSVNLVPVAYRRRLLVRRRLRQWVIVWVLAGTAMGTAGVSEYGRLQRQRETLARLEERCRPLRETEQDTQRIQQQLAVLGDRESLLAKLARSNPPAQLIGLVGLAAHGEEHLIRIGEFHLRTTTSRVMREERDEQGQVKRVPADIEKRQLALHGLGVDGMAVARFVSQLRQTGAFDSVMLKSSIEVPGQTSQTSLFEVECEYQ